MARTQNTKDLLPPSHPRVQALLEVLDLPVGSDIFDVAKTAKLIESCQRLPYESNPDAIKPHLLAAIKKRALAKNLDASLAVKLAAGSPAGWVLMVFPDAGKQRYQEDAQLAFLKQYSPAAEKLSANGPQAVYLEQGQLRTGFKEKPSRSSRSLDFKATSASGKDVYFVAKHTSGDGGAQNNQADHADAAISDRTMNSDFLVVILFDGTYYSDASSGKKKMAELRSLIKKNNVSHNTFAGNSYEVKAWLAQH